MKNWKGLLVLCCVLVAGTVGVGCADLTGTPSGSNSESVVPNEEITVKFDPCMENYEGLNAVGAEAGKRGFGKRTDDSRYEKSQQLYL